MFHLWGKERGFTPATMRIQPDETHWWLQKGDEILDLTAGQYTGDLDYSQGRKAAFLTKQPSKRAVELINRVKKGSSK
jgi:hypothetical protein